MTMLQEASGEHVCGQDFRFHIVDESFVCDVEGKGLLYNHLKKNAFGPSIIISHVHLDISDSALN